MGVMRFYRRQAEACLRLARECPDPSVAERYNLMAQDFLDRAAELPAEPELPSQLTSRAGAGRDLNRR
jgi:hypothetical protein